MNAGLLNNIVTTLLLGGVCIHTYLYIYMCTIIRIHCSSIPSSNQQAGGFVSRDVPSKISFFGSVRVAQISGLGCLGRRGCGSLSFNSYTQEGFLYRKPVRIALREEKARFGGCVHCLGSIVV